MSTCKHTSWLSILRKDHEPVLEIPSRPRLLLGSMGKPEEEFPNLVIQIGNQSKLRFLRRLGNCHDSIVRSLQSLPQPHKATEVSDHIFYRLLVPFANVVCFFADDVGGPRRVAHRLAAWLDKGQPSTIHVPPWHVLVVVEGSEDGHLAAFRDLIGQETSIDIRDRFAGIRIVRVGPEPGSSRRRQGYKAQSFSKLARVMSDLSNRLRQGRLASDCLFSALHLAKMLQSMAVHITQAPREPFDLVRTSRAHTPVAPDLDAHLARFLGNFRSLEPLKEVGVPLIASSFIDQYPSGMHRKSPAVSVAEIETKRPS
ncbi:phospholipase [Apiospora aurea]|uniref:Phospholipase n=1 Tax=Apiospora aurea TaxID=335848 RepID=A0ABR1Q5M6_9PEZI